jgi:hypothetical protein
MKKDYHPTKISFLKVFFNQVKNVRQIDVPTMSGNMGILGKSFEKDKG